MLSARYPICGKRPVCSDQAIGEPLCGRGSPHTKGLLLTYAEVPTSQQKASIIHIVIVVMVGEKQVVYLYR